MFSCVAFFGTAFVNSLNWALVPDTVDYGEWKTGIRAEGSVYTGYTFFRKISAALWFVHQRQKQRGKGQVVRAKRSVGRKKSS